MLASDIYPQTYIETLSVALDAAPETAARRNAVVCLADAQWAWETYNGDAAKARAIRGLYHLVGRVEAERLVEAADAVQVAYEVEEQAAECYAENAWLRAAEAPRFDPIEDEREANDAGLQEMRSWRDEETYHAHKNSSAYHGEA